METAFDIQPICLPKVAVASIDNMKNFPSVITGYGSASTKSSSLIHFAPLTIIGNEECTKKHYDNLEASNSEIDMALREQVNLILDSQKKISSQIVCTRAPIEDLGTCPGGYKTQKILEYVS